MSFARGGEVPQISTRKPRLRPSEFLTPSTKRLLQHGVIPGSSQTKARESALQEHMRPPHVALQRWRATMEYYVGLDVSLKQTSICGVDQAGLVVREGVVDSDPEAISVYVMSRISTATRSGHCWPAGRCWSRSSVISRTMFAAFSKISASSSAVPSLMSLPCEPRN